MKDLKTSKAEKAILHAFWIIAVSVCLFQALNKQGGLHAFPDYIHGWTQSDRLAIAVNYARYQPSFFYPGTPNLNPRLEQISLNDSGISAMDLPLAEYFSSWFMRLNRNYSPGWSRMIQICFALVALYSLFRIGLDIGCGIFSLVPVLILLGSPAWLFYASGFIPSIPALSLALLGVYFSFIRKRLITGIVLACLASLVRTPMLIVLIAMFIALLHEKLSRKKIILLIIVALTIYMPWFFWKRHLEHVYGTIFLNKFMPAESFDLWVETVSESLDQWSRHLFSWPGWILLIGSLSVFIFRRDAIRRNPLLLAGSAAFAGGFLFYILMAQQFIHHDYYYIDAFFIPLLLMASSSLKALSTLQPAFKRPLFIVIIITSFALPYTNEGVLAERTQSGPWDRYHLTLENYKSGENLLSKLGISEDKPVVVVDAYSTNAPLLLLNRKGYTILNTMPDELRKIKTIPVDFMVIQDVFLRSDVINSYHEIMNDWERIGGNGKLSVFRRLSGTRTEAEFTGISCCRELYAGTDFNDEHWSNINITEDSVLITSEEFGPTFRMKTGQGSSPLFWIDMELTAEERSAGVELVFKLHQGGELITRQYSLNDYTNRMSAYKFKCLVPFIVNKADAALEFFIYNPAKVKVRSRINDFRVLDGSCRNLIH